jgi:hypothetical protein
VGDEVRPGERLVGAAHERLEDRELLRRELNLDIAPPHPAAGRVEPEVSDFEHAGALRVRTGDHTSPDRNRRHVSKPSMPGSSTSRTIES